MARKGYTTIALPNVLLDQVGELVKNEKYGYVSKPEFIKDAVRRLLMEVKEKK